MFVFHKIRPMAENLDTMLFPMNVVKDDILNSWAPIFREYVLPNIDEEFFKCLYSDQASRPNVPVNQLLGAGILAAYEKTPIKVLFNRLSTNLMDRYALDLFPDPGTGEIPDSLTLKAFQRLINKCIRYRQLSGIDLIHLCFEDLFSKMAEILDINRNTVRMDSMLVSSSCRNLKRHELLYACNSLLVKELDALAVTLPDFATHYSDSDDRNNVLYRDASRDYEATVSRLIEDAHGLLQFCSENKQKRLNAFKILKKVFEQQTIQDEDGSYRLRQSEDGGMSSTMIQSPFDLDITYRCKNGKGSKGYVANLIEAFGGWGTIILGYEYEQNIYSDVAFFKDFLDKCNADGVYNGSAATKDAFPRLCDLEKRYREYVDSLRENDPDAEALEPETPATANAPGTVPDAAPDGTSSSGYDAHSPPAIPGFNPEAARQEESAPGKFSLPMTDEFYGQMLDDTVEAGGTHLKITTTDGAYFSVPLALQALDKGIVHIPTNLTGIVTPPFFAQFVFTLDGTQMLKCPAGYAPTSCSYNSRSKTCRCTFACDACKDCKYKEMCNPKMPKNNKGEEWVVYMSQNKKLRAVYSSFRTSEHFSNMCRFRNGVETLPSVLRNTYRVDLVRARGLYRSSIRFGFSAAGFNVQKLVSGLGRKARNERLSLEDYTREGRRNKKKQEAEEKARRREERERQRAERAAEKASRKAAKKTMASESFA